MTRANSIYFSMINRECHFVHAVPICIHFRYLWRSSIIRDSLLSNGHFRKTGDMRFAHDDILFLYRDLSGVFRRDLADNGSFNHTPGMELIEKRFGITSGQGYEQTA